MSHGCWLRGFFLVSSSTQDLIDRTFGWDCNPSLVRHFFRPEGLGEKKATHGGKTLSDASEFLGTTKEY